jgi:SAM-dependent methyltransferase
MVRLNIGCGSGPTEGWINYDNSLAVRLAKAPLLTRLLSAAGLIDAGNLEFIDVCRRLGVVYADAAHRIPHEAATVDVIYSSHMIEHLDRAEAAGFLAECRRVLKPGGMLRLAAPDLRWSILEYMEKGRADEFVAQLQFEFDKPRGLFGRLKWMLSGGRGHHWMYDGPSLSRLVARGGFAEVEILPAGQTRLVDPGALNLREREIESVYVEARRP